MKGGVGIDLGIGLSIGPVVDSARGRAHVEAESGSTASASTALLMVSNYECIIAAWDRFTHIILSLRRTSDQVTSRA